MTTTDLGARTTAPVLPDDLLARIDARTSTYDRENRFFDEDFAELRAAGLLDVALPVEYGGGGVRLDEYAHLLRRLAYHAPATALALNMHVYWTGVAADLLRAGDDSCRVILERAQAGAVLCALHGETGNDMPLVLSTTSAVRVEGGWSITGRKIFGSLAPVWTLGGFHAMDTSDPDNPQVVHGFVARDTPGVEIVDTWDTLGMRATQSQDTVLTDAFVPDELVVSVCPAGFAGAGPFHVGIFAWALLGFGAIYLGAARRAFDLAVENAGRRSSIALTGTMANHPGVQHQIADMRMAYDAAEALLERTATDWATGVAHPDWPVRLVGTRYTVINHAFDVVDRALDVSGGGGAFRRSRLEQLFRDVRMGRFHPGNTLLAHELIGKLCLGIDPDATPRWA